MNFAVITPTRGRPAQCADMTRSVYFTSGGGVGVFLAIDADDDTRNDYVRMVNYTDSIEIVDRTSLSEMTNQLAFDALDRKFPPAFLISMGDDHEVKTVDWHIKLRKAIMEMDGPGFAYGDDLMNGSGLCTSWMVSSEIVQALGWMMLPNCQHMYVDNAIMELGQATGRIAYVPEVIIEHKHHTMGKSRLDETYERTNTDEQYERDLKAFRKWRYGSQFRRDVNKILELKHEKLDS